MTKERFDNVSTKPSTTDGNATSSRRAEILAAAAAVFAERGLRGATVRDIGDAAGILSGSLYHHFESKEQIILELLLPSVRIQYAEASERAEAATTAVEAIGELIRSSIHTSADHPHETTILRNGGQTFAEVELLAPLVEYRIKTLELWRGVMRDGIARGEFRADIDPDIAVYGLVDGVLGAARWFLPPRDADPAEVADHLIRFYTQGLLKR